MSTTSTAPKTAVSSTPTLIKPTPFLFTPTTANNAAAPSIAPIPAAAQAELDALVQGAAVADVPPPIPPPIPPVSISESASTARASKKTVQPSVSAADLFADEDADPEEDGFLSPPDASGPAARKAKGKEKEKAPEASSSGGRAESPHPAFSTAGFVPGKTILNAKSSKDLRGVRTDLDGLCTTVAELYDYSHSMAYDLGDLVDFVPKLQERVDELEAQRTPATNMTSADVAAIANVVNGRADETTPALITATNTLSENQKGAEGVLRVHDARIFALEKAAPSAAYVERIRQLEATVASLSATVAALQARAQPPSPPVAQSLAPLPPPRPVAAPPLPGFMPPPPTTAAPPAAAAAPSALAAALGIDDVTASAVVQLLANNKRGRSDEGGGEPRNVRPRAHDTVTTPVPFVWAPASTPTLGTSVSAPPVAPPTASGPPAAPPRPPAAPRRPPSPPPRHWNNAPKPEADYSREMLIGPFSWTRENGRFNTHMDMKRIFDHVWRDTPIQFNSRRAPHPSYIICIFDTAEYADQMISAWNSADRMKYADVVASHPKA